MPNTYLNLTSTSKLAQPLIATSLRVDALLRLALPPNFCVHPDLITSTSITSIVKLINTLTLDGHAAQSVTYSPVC